MNFARSDIRTDIEGRLSRLINDISPVIKHIQSRGEAKGATEVASPLRRSVRPHFLCPQSRPTV